MRRVKLNIHEYNNNGKRVYDIHIMYISTQCMNNIVVVSSKYP